MDARQAHYEAAEQWLADNDHAIETITVTPLRWRQVRALGFDHDEHHTFIEGRTTDGQVFSGYNGDISLAQEDPFVGIA